MPDAPRRPVVDGTRCDDVDSKLIHISLAGLPDTPEKERLLAIPTGLTLKREDVDQLVHAGYGRDNEIDRVASFPGQLSAGAAARKDKQCAPHDDFTRRQPSIIMTRLDLASYPPRFPGMA